jgi:hypothetical protein
MLPQYPSFTFKVPPQQALSGGTLGRSGSLFSDGKGLDPLVLSKAPFPLPQLHTTFVISHNVSESIPFLKGAQ